jgi:hypothetical protein
LKGVTVGTDRLEITWEEFIATVRKLQSHSLKGQVQSLGEPIISSDVYILKYRHIAGHTLSLTLFCHSYVAPPVLVSPAIRVAFQNLFQLLVNKLSVNSVVSGGESYAFSRLLKSLSHGPERDQVLLNTLAFWLHSMPMEKGGLFHSKRSVFEDVILQDELFRRARASHPVSRVKLSVPEAGENQAILRHLHTGLLGGQSVDGPTFCFGMIPIFSTIPILRITPGRSDTKLEFAVLKVVKIMRG